MLPSIGTLQAKVWGDTRLLYAANNTHCHLIRFRNGGYCSKHRHQHKWNRFVVLQGTLIVRIFRNEKIHEETTVREGQMTDVPPGVWHQFEASEDGEALEFYWAELDAEDIERKTEGGMECEASSP